MNPCPLQWKCGVLTIEWPGKSQKAQFIKNVFNGDHAVGVGSQKFCLTQGQGNLFFPKTFIILSLLNFHFIVLGAAPHAQLTASQPPNRGRTLGTAAKVADPDSVPSGAPCRSCVRVYGPSGATLYV